MALTTAVKYTRFLFTLYLFEQVVFKVYSNLKPRFFIEKDLFVLDPIETLTSERLSVRQQSF